MTPVLALHCALASGSAWRGVAAALPGREVAAPDLPGHGRRGPAEGEFMDACLAVALGALPDGGPAHVVGHSYGAVVALRLLVEHPNRLASLTLVEPVLFAAHPEARAWTLSVMQPYADALVHGDREAAAAHFHGLWGEGAWDDLPAPARAYIAARIHLIGDSADGIVEDGHAILPRLPADAAPLLVTRRAPSLPMARIAEGLSERMPDMRHVALGEGHMIPMTEPVALAQALETHWAGR